METRIVKTRLEGVGVPLADGSKIGIHCGQQGARG